MLLFRWWWPGCPLVVSGHSWRCKQELLAGQGRKCAMDYAHHQSLLICSDVYCWIWVSGKFELERMLVMKVCTRIRSARSSLVNLIQDNTDTTPVFKVIGEEQSLSVSEHQGQWASARCVCISSFCVVFFRCLRCLPNHWGFKEVDMSLVGCIARTSVVLTEHMQ